MVLSHVVTGAVRPLCGALKSCSAGTKGLFATSTLLRPRGVHINQSDLIVLPNKEERICKWIARAACFSRRQAECLIAEGRVTLDGEKVATPATIVRVGNVVAVDGAPVQPAKLELFRHYKKRGVLVTHAPDSEGRRTLFEELKKMGMRPFLHAVGRLDYNSEGLLLLTTSGELAGALAHPSLAWRRVYKVKANGLVDAHKVQRLQKPIRIDGTTYGPMKVNVTHKANTNTWFEVTLHEGQNREIRRRFEFFGLTVARIIRTHYGPFQLSGLEKGDVMSLPVTRPILSALQQFRRLQSTTRIQ